MSEPCEHRESSMEWLWLDDGDGEWIEYSTPTTVTIDHETYRCTRCDKVMYYVQPEDTIP